MTEQEYIDRFIKRGVIGLCELCKDFTYCTSKGKLREHGCEHHTNFREE